jgi:pyruvate ferredoxin oxidoreductase gamma subunit
MRNVFETVWLGRGGQGAFTAARLLGLSAVRFAGKQALAFPSFGPERRGAPVFAYTRIDDKPIRDRSAVRRADVAVIMDPSLLIQVATGFLTPDTRVIVDAEILDPAHRGPNFFPVPAKRIAREILGADRTNTILLGVLIGLTRWLPLEAVVSGIEAEFGGETKSAKNVAAFHRGRLLGLQLADASEAAHG